MKLFPFSRSADRDWRDGPLSDEEMEKLLPKNWKSTWLHKRITFVTIKTPIGMVVEGEERAIGQTSFRRISLSISGPIKYEPEDLEEVNYDHRLKSGGFL